MIVVVEGPGASLFLDRHSHCRRIGEVNIRPTVTIIVKQQDTSAHRFNDVFFFGIGRVFEIDSSLSGDVSKLRYRTAAALFRLCSRGRGRSLWMPTSRLAHTAAS